MPQSDMHPQPIDGVLLDMDGTILNSIPAAKQICAEWAMHHGLDVAAFLPTIHGVQSVETIRRLGLPGVDPVAEAERIIRAEIEETSGIEQIAGADEFPDSDRRLPVGSGHFRTAVARAQPDCGR